MQWVNVFAYGTSNQKPVEGQLTLVTVGAQRICLLRRGGNVFAFQDNCPHSGESLSRGKINYLGEIVCPAHGHCFNIRHGREVAERSADLETFPVREDDSGLYIAI